jgi:Glycosyltransferase family 87
MAEGTLRTEGDRRTSVFSNPPVVIVLALVAVRIVVLVATLQADRTRPVRDDDVLRFGQIATATGTPYRDFPVEYMPVELLTIRAIAGDGASATAVRLALISFAADLAAVGALWYGWGRRGASMYLLLGLPLQTFILFRVDPVAVAMAAWSMALARRRRDGPAGGLLAAAVLTKLWPVVLVPWFLVSARWRVTAWFAATGAVGLAVWVALGGIRAPWQVLTFRGAHGWAVESTIGNVVWLVTGGPIRLEAGAVRTGDASVAVQAILVAAIAGVLTLVWVRARRDATDPAGGPALVAVTALIAFSPLFSVQYSCWLVPWAAVASLGGRRERTAAILAAAIVAMGGLLAILYGNATVTIIGSIKLLLLIRNALCVGLVAFWLLARSPARASAPAEA